MIDYSRDGQIDQLSGCNPDGSWDGVERRASSSPENELLVSLENLDNHLKALLRLQIRKFIYLSHLFCNHTQAEEPSFYWAESTAGPVERAALSYQRPGGHALAGRVRCRYRKYRGRDTLHQAPMALTPSRHLSERELEPLKKPNQFSGSR